MYLMRTDSALTDEEEADLIFRVDDGAEFFDAVLPGWRQQIDLDRLTLGGLVLRPKGSPKKDCGCIVQQINGLDVGYDVSTLGITEDEGDGEEYGFVAPIALSFSDRAKTKDAYEVLQRRWEEQILFPEEL